MRARRNALEACLNSRVGFSWHAQKTRRKPLIFRVKVPKLEEVLLEMLFLALQTLKLGGDSWVLRGRHNTLE